MKEYGADLKKKFEKSYSELNNVQEKIWQRYFMIIERYHEYVDYKLVQLVEKEVALNSDMYKVRSNMLKMIMKAEANYVKKTSKQLELFN